jgi:hypothetical protein
MAERFGLSRRRVGQLVTSVKRREQRPYAREGGGVKHEELRRDAVVVPVALALVRAAVVRGDRGPDAWLAAIRRHLARVDELTDEIAGDDTPGEEYLAKAGRLTAARPRPKKSIRHEIASSVVRTPCSPEQHHAGRFG